MKSLNELIQESIGYRSMSYLDMIANSLGVIIGWFLAGTHLSAFAEDHGLVEDPVVLCGAHG